MKVCRKCLIRKSLSEFYRRKTGKRAGNYYTKCKECMKIRGREYYHINHERQLALALIRKRRVRLKRREFVNNLKDRPCADCGGRYPSYVMDFDHRKGEEKLGDIGHSFANWSFDQISKEAGKCDIVCANCHRIRTFRKYAELA